LGNLSPRRDFTFAADTAAGMAEVGCCDAAVGEVVNLGSGKDIAVGELATLIMELLGKEANLAVDEERVRPVASEVDRLLADASKARRLAKWEPVVPLREGLERTIAWIASHRDRYRPDRYTL
jgi:nucleoside-diphosphate-sugar epimerase